MDMYEADDEKRGKSFFKTGFDLIQTCKQTMQLDIKDNSSENDEGFAFGDINEELKTIDFRSELVRDNVSFNSSEQPLPTSSSD